MTDITLTSEQRKFLEECEEEFKDRFTEKDNNFVDIKMQEPKKPPIVDPWYNKTRRYESRHDQTQTYSRHNHYWNHRNNDRNSRNERYAWR